MNIPQNKRTQHDILRFLKTSQMNGVIKKSMMDIAKDTGYSNATIHRSIKALEKDGYIQVIPAKSARKPNTIVYIGPADDEVESILSRANIAVRNLIKASNEVQNILKEIEQTIPLIDVSQEHIELH